MPAFKICKILMTAIVIFIVGHVFSQFLWAANFRVDNAVYVGEQTQPASESTTIFYENNVYDCMKYPAEIVVFERKIDQFTLLNLKQRIRTQLSTGEILAFVDRLQIRAAKSSDPLVRFLAGPKFQESVDESTGEVLLKSPLVSYRLTLASQTDREIVDQYHEFCDWSARLNSLLVPGSRPPFGRLVVDAAMAKRQAIASSVILEMTIGKSEKQQQVSMRSEHRIISPLEQSDLKRVEQAREMMDRFKLVTFDVYRKSDPK